MMELRLQHQREGQTDPHRPTRARPWRVMMAVLFASCGSPEGEPRASYVSGDGCGLEIDLIASLHGEQVDRSGIGLVTPERILLVTNNLRHEILVFDHHGRFRNSVGRRGEGPGEFHVIHELRPLPGGRIAVVDARQARITYLDRDLEPQGVVRIPVMIYPHGAVLMADGGWLLTGLSLDRAHFGSAVIEVDSAGAVRRLYGENETVKEGPARGQMPTRHVAYHPSVGVVTMQTIDYAIEVWSPEGPLAEVIRPDAEWFRWPPEGYGERREEGPSTNSVGFRPPEDRVAGIQFDEEGRLWILSRVTPGNWEEGLGDNGQIVDWAKYADFVLQVYDFEKPDNACHVRLTDEYYFGGFAGPGILKTYSEDSIGNPTVTVQRLTVR